MTVPSTFIGIFPRMETARISAPTNAIVRRPSAISDIAQAADRFGFKGVLLPTVRGVRKCLDRRGRANSGNREIALPRSSSRRRNAGALCPLRGNLDRISGGRVLLNVVTGADPADLAGDGNKLSPNAMPRQTNS
ncbi:hypothetical protein RFM99_11185 [Mesorhizobium sp. VK4C]|uniref:hypothetical protein n=1 Tax=Mesorhizobium captivum TaxID=3072319 RepID=UPI002A2492A6|nr:hypothetical protein [Mesorhizobium sp. VK4C]MDX8498986.1 hypothetical protein [Mesorhizobium sp. VK4C]